MPGHEKHQLLIDYLGQYSINWRTTDKPGLFQEHTITDAEILSLANSAVPALHSYSEHSFRLRCLMKNGLVDFVLVKSLLLRSIARDPREVGALFELPENFLTRAEFEGIKPDVIKFLQGVGNAEVRKSHFDHARKFILFTDDEILGLHLLLPA